MNDLAAPLLTILNTYGMQTTFANIKLGEYQRKNQYRSSIPVEAFNLPYQKEDTIPYPMNWVISQYNINRMDKNVDSVKLDRIK